MFATAMPSFLVILLVSLFVTQVTGEGSNSAEYYGGIRDFLGPNLGVGLHPFDPTVQAGLRQHQRHRLAYLEEQADSADDGCTTKDLIEFPQWQAEEGYWIGEYTFYGSDGAPFNSSSWNYRYDSYRGFITGAVAGSSYRQRNVFLYPPQSTEECQIRNEDVVGNGTCGVNGNTKIFFADQTAPNGTCDGSIGGDFAGIFDTTTDLIGKDNAVLYQVFFKDFIPTVGGTLFQSQLTTLTQTPDGTQRRTRTAQSFTPTGEPQSVSFYREYKVSEEEFYAQLETTITEYNILEEDTCGWMDDFDGSIVRTDLVYEGEPGFGRCVEHLEDSFNLEA